MTVTAQQEQELLQRVPTGLLINGEWVEASSGKTLPVYDPATGKELLRIQDGNSEDALKALTAADEAQAEWALTAPRERAEILRRAFDIVMERADEFALLMTLEMGKPLAEARGEVTYGAEFLRWFSEETVRHYGRFYNSPENNLTMIVRHKPVGPSLLVTPWNFPLAMATRKVAPAIASGSTMVLKPAQLTPLTSQYFAQAMLDAGLPAGVLNVVSGSSASAISGPLLKDSRLRKLSFTGSTSVGVRLMEDAAQNVLRTSMELGGNAPLIVFEDADLEKAVQGAMDAKLRNMGEACTAANRILVHEDIADAFQTKFAEAMRARKVGRGTKADVNVGPIIDEKAREEVHSLVAEAVEAGGEVVTGGKKIEGDGYFYEPTILSVLEDSPILKEEIFGPVAPVVTFKDEAHAIRLANAQQYGLAAYLFTENHNRAIRVADQIEFGLIGFNAGVISNAAAPFGGVKQSGLGREGGAEGIAEYTTVQYIGMPNPHSQA